jgi:hypothetical protein
MTLRLALNVSDGVWPAYASQLIIEVYEQSDKSFSVRILYNGKVQKLPWCGDKEMCDMATAAKFVKTIAPLSSEECQTSKHV